MAKDDENTKSKKKDTSPALLSGSADGSGLRRSGRETPSKKQATASTSSNARRSERIESPTTPNSTPNKKKQDKIEEQVGPSPLRRSDRSKKQLSHDSSGSKKLVEVSSSSDIKSKKEKITSSQNKDSGDVSVDNKSDNKNERQDPDAGGRKRKRMTVRGYKALFKPQKLRIEAEGGQDSNVQHTSPESGRSTESGNGEKQIVDKCTQDNNGKMSTQNMDIDACEDNDNQISPKSPSSVCKKHGDDETGLACSKEQRINSESKNQQELDSHDKACDKDSHGTHTSKVRKTCPEVTVMENTENNNTKFVEFWVPVHLSNVQLEQYCATLLSGAMALRSCSKNDSFGALHNILISNCKCCNHPYIVEKDLQTLVTKDQPQAIHWEIGYKASAKVHFLDLILPELKKRNLRVVILFQPTPPTGGGTSYGLGDILDDFVRQRFGEDSYERVDGAGMRPPKKQAALNNFNNDKNKFIFLLGPRACQSSVKLSSVDIIIIFDSDLNPANDIHALQKISIDSDSEKIMIFRLYSKNTLEEKILKLAEQNVAVDSKLHTLNRITCDALLMWGAKDLFKKLESFHGKSGKEITSEEGFLKDVMEEFMYIISNKCKSKDGEKSMITNVQSCGYYGNKNIPTSEIKSQLQDGEQPHVFWRNLLEGKYPRWKFVSVITSRQRKRPQLYTETPDIIAPVADGVKKRKRSPALKPVIEKQTGWASDGGLSGSQSPSGDPFWSSAVHNDDLLKPVSQLCVLLKFPVNVKNTVEKFLDFVLENYNVSKEHKSDKTTLEAFMISLCWIGASLSNHKIDKKESFSLAKKHLNFDCREEEANVVYVMLEEARDSFTKQTENQENKDDSENIKPPVEATCTESTDPKKSTESQHDQNVEISATRECKEETLEFTAKESEEIEKFKREWDEERAVLENDYKVEKALIRTLHANPSVRSEKLKALDKKFASKYEELERNKEILLKDLKATLLAADVAADNEVHSVDSEHGVQNLDKPDTSISVENPDGGGDKLTEIPLELDGDGVQDKSKEGDSLGIGTRNDIESTGSHTSEKEMVDVTVSYDVPVVEIPPHQHDIIDDDMAVDVTGEIPEKQGDEIVNNVEGHVDSLELGIPEVNTNEENSKGGSSGADVAIRDESGEMGVSGGDANKENGEGSHAVEDQNDSCGSSSSNQPPADVPQDDTPSVPLVTSQAPDHPLEIQNKSVEKQLSELEIQDIEGQADPISLPEMDADNPPPPVDTQINPEEPHHDPMAENQSDVNPPNGISLETNCENDVNAPEQTQVNLDEQQSVSLHNTIPPEIPNQNVSLPEINIFDVHVPSRVPYRGDPLQAELERLHAVKDKFTKFHEETKLRLKSECEKEIAEMIAQITKKYEAKYKEEDTTFQLKRKELDSTMNRVVMNKILAEAFRAKCQDLTASGPGIHKDSQAGLMQQLNRVSVQLSSSPGQPSRRQQTPPPPPASPSPPPPQPPLQIVHQPAALFSNTVIRPPPTITPVTPITRPPPNITPITPSAGSLRGPAPHLRPPLLNSEIRAPAPHLRPFKPATSASPDFTPAYRKTLPGQHVTSPLNSQPPVLPPLSTSSVQLPPLSTSLVQLPPLPPETSYVPPPPPPPPPNNQHLVPQIPQIPTNQPPSLFSTSPDVDFFDLTGIIPVDDDAHPSSGHDVVCLSDDD